MRNASVLMRLRTALNRLGVLAGLVSTAIGLAPGRALAQSNPVNLERLVRDAGIIFSGRVVGVVTGEKEPRMNLYMTSYTFVVEEGLYGVTSDSVIVKQYGGDADGQSYYPPGVPRFEPGEAVVVFLYPLSKIGMTSAVAKGQGKFVVGAGDSNGVRLVENATRNKNLFRRIRYADQIAKPEWLEMSSEGPIEYDPFIASIRNLIGILKK